MFFLIAAKSNLIYGLFSEGASSEGGFTWITSFLLCLFFEFLYDTPFILSSVLCFSISDFKRSLYQKQTFFGKFYKFQIKFKHKIIPIYFVSLMATSSLARSLSKTLFFCLFYNFSLSFCKSLFLSPIEGFRDLTGTLMSSYSKVLAFPGVDLLSIPCLLNFFF